MKTPGQVSAKSTVHRISVQNGLDGSASGFGDRFWNLLRTHTGVRQALASCGELQSMTYTDRYLLSPLSIRLLCTTLLAAGAPTGVNVLIRTTDGRAAGREGVPVSIAHDWRDESTRKAVLGTLLRKAGFTCDVEVGSRSALPHARVLRLSCEAGSVDMILDQGFGYWRSVKSVPFPFTASIAGQAEALTRTEIIVAGQRSFPTELFVDKI